jgi:DNA-binding winged helix-turn-helix (wHTH) protein
VAERLLKKADKPIPLRARALDLLIVLAERAGEVVTHKELMSTVWPDVTVEEGNLRFQMATLRKTLGDGRDGARYISNVAGRGYCFVAPVTRSSAEQKLPVNLANRRLGHVDESVVFHALYVNGFVSSEHWPGFQKDSDLGILRAAVHFRWNGFGVIDRHFLLPSVE